MKTQLYPPGFEGEPRYKRNTPKETQTMPSYSAIQHTCAKKLNIFLPAMGYSHIVLEEDDIDKIYEMAYRNEFRVKATNAATIVPVPVSVPGGSAAKAKGSFCKMSNEYSNLP